MQECPAYPGNKKQSEGFEWPTTPKDDCSTFLREVRRYMGHMFWKVDLRGCGNWHALLFIYLFLYFLEHFAHFHFRSHLQSLINGESHQIKLEQSQWCRPEANWRRRLSSPATSRSLPLTVDAATAFVRMFFCNRSKGQRSLRCRALQLFRCLLAAEFLPGCVRMHVRTSEATGGARGVSRGEQLWNMESGRVALPVTPVL